MIYLLIAFVALQIADGVSTYLVINKGGYEANPIVAWGLNHLGLAPGLIAYKGLGVVLGYVLYKLADHGGNYLLAVLIAFYGGVVYHNYKAYKSLT